ncbi:MAG: nucleotide exchange factor GrpE, partial [Anaerovorax sp.]
MTKEKKPKDNEQACEDTMEKQECSKEDEDLIKDEKENTSQEKAEDASEFAEDNIQYLRLMADFQNYKKRTEKEKGDIYAFANEKLVSELLDVIDNFE